MEPVADSEQPESAKDQLDAAGFDAVAWAERIAPAAWGHADDGDDWVDAVRCLALAAAVTARSSGCPHTADGSVAVPVIAVPRAAGVLRCPTCAEPVVASVSANSSPCDRCGSDSSVARVAVIAGQSLIVVTYLCTGCRDLVLGFSHLALDLGDG